MPLLYKKNVEKFKIEISPYDIERYEYHMEMEKEDKYFGRTKFMNPVKLESKTCKIGELVNVKIKSYNQNGLFGYESINKNKAA